MKPQTSTKLGVSGHAPAILFVYKVETALYQWTQNKQAVLVVNAESRPLTPDVVFILLPVFGLQTNHSFKADHVPSSLATPFPVDFHHDMKSIICRRLNPK